MSKIALKIYLSRLYLSQPVINIVQIELNQFVFSSTAYFTLRKEMQIEDLYFSFNKYSVISTMHFLNSFLKQNLATPHGDNFAKCWLRCVFWAGWW